MDEQEPETSNEHQAVVAASDSQTKPPNIVYLLTFMAAIGGFLFGYDTGVISGVILILADLWNLSDLWQELVVSVTTAGAAIFSLFGGFLNHKFGRKPVILASSFLFLIGSFIMAFCNSRGVLLLGRLTVGAAIGLSSTTIPAYICEAAPHYIRGRLITVFQLLITFGFFVAGLLNACFSYLSDEISWRLMLGVGAIPSAFQLFGFIFMPESPRWEVMKGHQQNAREILLKLNHSEDVAEKELIQINSDQEEAEKILEKLGGDNAFMTMVKTPRFRRALIVGCSLQMFQQLSGINTVAYYTGSIIEMAGIEDNTTEMWLTAGTYGVNFLCTFVGMYFVERIGRRLLLLSSSADNSGALYGRCSIVDEDDNDDVIYESFFSSWSYGFCPTKYSWLVVLGMLLYLCAFSSGFGPMPWTLNAEIYPNWARSTGTACATSTNWTFNLFVSLTFLSLARAITRQGVFYFYAILSFVGLIWFYFVVPETKNLSIEQVEELFENPWCGKRPKIPDVQLGKLQRKSGYEEID